MMIRTAGGLMAVLLLAGTSAAQDFTIDWFTVDGGGGDCAGGIWSLSGTSGQPDAGRLSGGAFELTGGFWACAPGEAACTGSERISKTSCKDRNGSNLLKVILVGGVEGDTFTVRLTDGSSKSGVINRRGKGKAKFNNRPAGDTGTASAEWGCGAVDAKAYACP